MGTGAPVTFGPFELDPATYRLRREGVTVPLEPKAVDLLLLLVSRAPRVVDKAEIFTVVWKDVAVTDNALTRIVAQLRKALDDDARAPRYIETIATRGYRFVAEAAPGADARAAVPNEAAPARLPRPAMWALAAVAVAVAIVAAVTAWPWQPWPEASSQSPDSPGGSLAARVPVQVTTGTGYDGFSSFAPDGRSIAFSSDRSGAFEVYVQALAPGATPTALTANGRQNLQPVWSPDGQFIAYHEMHGGGVWVVAARGGVPRRLADFGSHPAWSPDGTRIAFQSMPVTNLAQTRAPGVLSTIWVVPSDGGQPSPVTTSGAPPGPHLAPAWAHDGTVVFAATALDGPTSLWRVAATGAGLRQVMAHARLSAEFSVDPRGRGVFFGDRSSNAIWWQPFDTTGAAGGEPRPTGLAVFGGMTAHLSLSGDGRQLAWTSMEATGQVWSQPSSPLAAGQPATALTAAVGVRYSHPVAARDGRVAVVGQRAGSGGTIYVLDPHGSPRPVTHDDGVHLNPQWLPGERELAHLSERGGEMWFEAVDVETGLVRTLFPVSALPVPPGLRSFSASTANNEVPDPAFTRVAVTLIRDGVPNIWVASLSGGSPDGRIVQRTFEVDGGSFPAWSPDGRWLAYQCQEGTTTHVCVTGVEGEGRLQLTREPGQSWVGGWVDDDGILFAAQRHGVWNVMAVSRKSGAVRPVTAGRPPRTLTRYPRWDEAGRRVLFEHGELTARVFRVTLPE